MSHNTKKTSPKWRRCKYAEADQYRSRVLTGSIGLEGRWTEWMDGKPERCAMNREYQYRTGRRTIRVRYWVKAWGKEIEHVVEMESPPVSNMPCPMIQQKMDEGVATMAMDFGVDRGFDILPPE